MRHWQLEVKLIAEPQGECWKASVIGGGHPLEDTEWFTSEQEANEAGRALRKVWAGKNISVPQNLILKLLGTVFVNNLDGEVIAADLRANADLWRAVEIKGPDFLTLRDLGYGNMYRADMILAVVPKDKLEGFLELARTWNPDEIGYRDSAGKVTGPFFTEDDLKYAMLPAETGEVFVRLWWD